MKFNLLHSSCLRHLLEVVAILLCLLPCSVDSFAFNNDAKDKLLVMDASSIASTVAIADSLVQTGNFEKALLAYSRGVKKGEAGIYDLKGDERDALLNAYLGLVDVYLNYYVDYSSALRMLNAADKARSVLGIQKDSIDFWYGVLYMTVGEQNSAADYNMLAFEKFVKVYESSKINGNENFMHYAMSNILVNSAETDTNSIRPYAEDYRSRVPSDNYKDIYEFNILIADISSGAISDLAVAKDRMDSVLKDSGLPRTRYYPYLLYMMSSNARKSGDYSTAIQALVEASDVVSGDTGSDMLQTIYKNLYEIYRDSGNDQKAAEYYLKYANVKEKTSSFSQIRNLRSVEVQREMDDLEDNLNNEKERSRFLFYGICGIALFLVVCCTLLILLFRKNRNLQESYSMLYAKNIQILDIEEENNELRAQMETDKGKDPAASELSESDQSRPSPPRRAEQIAASVMDIIKTSEEVFDSEFSASRLAEMVGCSYTTLSTAINSQFGMNFHQLIAERRIKEVCRRIDESDKYLNLSSEAIAESVGIKSRTTFTTAFKKVTGMTPSAYLKIARQKLKSA